MSASMRLLYFPLRARAEPLRMLFRHARVEVADEVVSFSAWPAIKPTVRNQKLPQLLLDDGELLPETVDIALHVAKLATERDPVRPLLPADADEAREAEYCWREAHETSVPFLGSPWSEATPWNARIGACNSLLNMLAVEEARPLIPLYLEGARPWLQGLESRLDVMKAPFFGGSMPHHGDFASWHLADQITTLDGGAALRTCDLKVQLWYASVAMLPAVASYIAERPQAGTGQVGLPGSLLHTSSVPHEAWA
jgi:glutathione S-transferase